MTTEKTTVWTNEERAILEEVYSNTNCSVNTMCEGNVEWTPEEDVIIRETYEKVSSLLPNRSREAILARIAKLGIKR